MGVNRTALYTPLQFKSFFCLHNIKKNGLVTRPPKVRPKKSNFGGRYFYVKIQL